MKKRISIFLTAILMLGILSGCGASNHSNTAGLAQDNFNYFGVNSVKGESASGGMSFDGDYSDMVFSPQAPSINDMEPADSNIIDGYVEAKKVYSANVQMQTKDIDAAINDIYKRIEETGSYIEDESRQNWNSYDSYNRNRYLDITIRVPSKNFNTFLETIENDNLIVTELSRSVQDYSTAYYDKESRVNSLRVQEERLLELLSKAENVTIMLEIERNLANVRYEIESLTKEMRTIDSKVEYSTINIWLREVGRYTSTATPKTFGERISVAFQEAIENFKADFEDFLVDLAYDWPYLLLNVCFIVLILFVIRFVFKKIKSKKLKKLQSKPKVENKEEVNIADNEEFEDKK